MRILFFVVLFFSYPVFAETVQIQMGFNLFYCEEEDGDVSCVSPSIKYETINLELTRGKGYFEKKYHRNKFTFDFSIKVSEYFNSSTNKKNYILYLNLLPYVKGEEPTSVPTSASISITDFDSLNEIEIDGTVIAKDNVRALPFFGVASLNKIISIKKSGSKSIKKENRLRKILQSKM